MKSKIIIIGSGFGGIATAKKLLDEGETDFLILERAGDVGGVWRDNAYPGAVCDVQSHLYSFSFDLNANWEHDYGRQPEIYAYLRKNVEKWGLLPKVRLNEDVMKLKWHEEGGEWEIVTTQATYRAQFVVGAFGNLSDPSIPKIKGLESFEGEVTHSAQWTEDFSYKGKRVAIIGTGASAIQIVPCIQPEVEKLMVFQRTPPWILPRYDEPIPNEQQQRYASQKWRMRLERARLYFTREFNVLGFMFPRLMKKPERQALNHLKASVPNVELRKKLTPNYTIGCKRVLLSNTYYPAIGNENVEVTTSGVRSITKDAIVGSDGVSREVDSIILSTGFMTQDMPFTHIIYGKDGRTLADTWGDDPQSLVGTSMVNFPNFFLLHGPNTGLGHTSGVFILEIQAEHAISCILHALKKEKPIIEPRLQAQEAFQTWIQKKSKGTVWTSGGCQSWYLDDDGKNTSLWPSFTFAFRSRVRKIRPKEYELRDLAGPAKLNEVA
ncbi:flavin-containing monooxygenase [Flexibacterium corallicola]|uniref:flavin-containing monooxygenase n=1 Tax=Flexibacterium corallicola TaxID=3037259 RepID=UPI00286EC947|nr:NAD(P)/FAD-dependent oxidoreductase [Pseudovibrio sp. M1P-2-3]